MYLLLVSSACQEVLSSRYSAEKPRPGRIILENRDPSRDGRRDQSRRESQISVAVTKRDESSQMDRTKHVKFVQGGVQTSFPYQFVSPMQPTYQYVPSSNPQYSNTLHSYTPHLNGVYDAYSATKPGPSPSSAMVKYEFLPKPSAQTAVAPTYSQQSFSQGGYNQAFHIPAPQPQAIIPTSAPTMLLVMAPPHPGNPYGTLMLIPTQGHQGVFPQQPLTLIPVPTAVPSTPQFRNPVPVYPTVSHPNLIPFSFKPIHSFRNPYQQFATNYAQKSMDQNSGAASEESQMPEQAMEMTNGHSHSQTTSKDQTFGQKVPNFRPISVAS